jgi:hypothetical protein
MCRFMSSAVLGTAFAAEAGDTSAPPFKNYSPRSGRDQGEPEGEPHGGSNREAAFTTSIRTHTSDRASDRDAADKHLRSIVLEVRE